MFPAPPRPPENLAAEGGNPCVKREAGPWARVGEVVFGALKWLPAPPRPECM